jgi:hypothetical protein
MLITIVRKITPAHIDTPSDRFQPGCQYEVGSPIGRLFIAEGWALPVVGQAPVLMVSPVERPHGTDQHSTTPQHAERSGPSLKEAIAADTALDDAIAGAIERQGRSLNS